MAKRSFIADTESDNHSESGTQNSNVHDISKTLIERSYNQLRLDIIEGRLPPDEKLRVEHLKERYQVGAGTLREAMSRLISDNLIIAEGQRGFKVAPVNIEDLEDITRTRIQLEIEALRQSIRMGDNHWRTKLALVHDELDALGLPGTQTDRSQWEYLNNRFHVVLIESYASAWTLKFLDMLARHGERYRRLSISLNLPGRDVRIEHRDIFQSAMSGNDVRAALALESHIRATTDLLRETIASGIDVFS
jgi:DNA-binding GntR family transcriptional regulator